MDWTLLAALAAVCMVAAALVIVGHGGRRWSIPACESDPAAASCAGWLSPGLSQLVLQTRVLRLVLETPLARFGRVSLGETPWRRRERCDEYDLALVNLRQAVWDWLRMVERLDPVDHQVLCGLGLSTASVCRVMGAKGVLERTDDPWEDVLFPTPPNVELLSGELRRAALHLERFEAALRSRRDQPYR